MAEPRLVNCIFCGDQQVPGGEEDVLPRWVGSKLRYYAQHHPGVEPVYVGYDHDNPSDFRTDVDDRSGTQATGMDHTGGRPMARKLPDVCMECNRGWMSRLEQSAGLLIPGFLVGESKILTPYDQFNLSTWMVKTCLTYDAARSERFIPEWVSRSFSRSRHARRRAARRRPLPQRPKLVSAFSCDRSVTSGPAAGR
jgi:hypothetical protein